MVGWFRLPAAILQALHDVVNCLRAIVDRIADHEAIQHRVAELERTRALWDAEIEGRLAKIDQLFKATRGAEERARSMLRRHNDALPEDDDDEVDTSAAGAAAWDAAVGAHAPAGAAEGLQPVHPRLVGRDAARARKWGRA